MVFVCVFFFLKKARVRQDIIYSLGNIFNPSLWMLTKCKVLVHISMYLKLGKLMSGCVLTFSAVVETFT